MCHSADFHFSYCHCAFHSTECCPVVMYMSVILLISYELNSADGFTAVMYMMIIVMSVILVQFILLSVVFCLVHLRHLLSVIILHSFWRGLFCCHANECYSASFLQILFW